MALRGLWISFAFFYVLVRTGDLFGQSSSLHPRSAAVHPRTTAAGPAKTEVDCEICKAAELQDEQAASANDLLNKLGDAQTWETFRDQSLGQCLLPADFKAVTDEWKRYQFAGVLRTTTNAQRMAASMHVSASMRTFAQDLQRIAPLAKDLDVISKSAYFQKLAKPKGQVDSNFLDFAKSSQFLETVRGPGFVDKNQNRDFLSAYNDPQSADFKNAIKDVQKNLNDPAVWKSVGDLEKQGISIVDPTQLKDYEALMGFFRGKQTLTAQSSATDKKAADALNRLFDTSGNFTVPLQSEIPLPSIGAGAVSKQYLQFVNDEMEKFLFKSEGGAPITQDMIASHLNTLVLPHETLKQSLMILANQCGDNCKTDGQPDIMKALNDAKPPATRNWFDEKVATQFFDNVHDVTEANRDKDVPDKANPDFDPKSVFVGGQLVTLTAADVSQIDMVARTLLGEVMECEGQGLGQAEAVGMVIAQRSLAVSAANSEEQRDEKINMQIQTNDESVLDSGNAAGLGRLKTTQLRGRLDFGRDLTTDFPSALPPMPAGEVVSRNLQFSVWQPHTAMTLDAARYGNLGKNLPDHKFQVYGPLTQSNLEAQVRGLCPQIPRNSEASTNVPDQSMWHSDFSRSQPAWNKMTELALQIVKDPAGYLRRYTWKPPVMKQNHIYFYTHGPTLDFANLVQVDSIHDNVAGKDLKLRGSSAPCNLFKAYAPKNVNVYEPK